MTQSRFRPIRHLKMTVRTSVLWKIHTHMAKKWPGMVVQRSFIKEHSFVNRLYVLKHTQKQKFVKKPREDTWVWDKLWKRNDHTNYFTFQGFPLINWCWKFINSLKFSRMSLLLRVVHSNLTTKLYIPSTLNIDLILWHIQLILCAVKF